MKTKNITLMDIGNKLNITKMTVSKALRDHPDISDEMKEKVKKVANKLGYFPNRFASNLSSQRSHTIGVVVPKIAHYFFASIIESIYDKVFENDYEAILMVSQENAKREKEHLESLLSMRVDGILISISQETNDYSIFETIRKMKVPLVFVDRVIKDIGFSCVSVDDRKGTFELIDYAIKAGYKKIAHVAGPPNVNISNERLKGFKDALKNNGLQINNNWIVESGFSERNGYDGFMKIVNQGTLPELVFAVTFPVAMGILEAAKDVGIKIPKDMNVACFGRTNYNRIITPSISCVVQPTKELGTRSVELLLSEIENPRDFKPQNIILGTKLEIYDSFNLNKNKR